MTFNLLWPPGCEPFAESAVQAQDPFVHDLGLQRLAEALNRDRKHLAHAQRLLGALTCDEEVIRYRNGALADLLELPALRTGLLELLPTIERLRERYRDRRLLKGLHPSRRLAWRLDLATLFIEGTRALRTLLDRYRTRLTSAALSGLLAHLDALARADAYQALEAEAGRYARRLERITSVAIGVNLSGDLRP
ncbi:MAG TPA: hypothetical protein VFK80_09175, partial [Limnochordia bacterium]|nr:hypothetical protein [Limnochordia bacterium]